MRGSVKSRPSARVWAIRISTRESTFWVVRRWPGEAGMRR
jgi:hypothetical protein